MERVRLTDRPLPYKEQVNTRTAAAARTRTAKLYDNADPMSMNNPSTNPDSEKYEGKFEDEEQSHDTKWRKDQTSYDDDTNFMLDLEDDNGMEMTASAHRVNAHKKVMAQKAACCIKLAQQMFPHAVGEFVEAQADSFMKLPHQSVIASMKRLDMYNADPKKAAALVSKINKTADEDEDEADEAPEEESDEDAMDMDDDEPTMDMGDAGGDGGDLGGMVDDLQDQIQDAQDHLEEIDDTLEGIEDALEDMDDLTGGESDAEDDLEKEIIASMNLHAADYSNSCENDIDFTQNSKTADFEHNPDSRLESLFMTAGLSNSDEDDDVQVDRLRKSASVTGKKKIDNLKLSETVGRQVPRTKTASRTNTRSVDPLSVLWESTPDVSGRFSV